MAAWFWCDRFPTQVRYFLEKRATGKKLMVDAMHGGPLQVSRRLWWEELVFLDENVDAANKHWGRVFKMNSENALRAKVAQPPRACPAPNMDVDADFDVDVDVDIPPLSDVDVASMRQVVDELLSARKATKTPIVIDDDEEEPPVAAPPAPAVGPHQPPGPTTANVSQEGRGGDGEEDAGD